MAMRMTKPTSTTATMTPMKAPTAAAVEVARMTISPTMIAMPSPLT